MELPERYYDLHDDGLQKRVVQHLLTHMIVKVTPVDESGSSANGGPVRGDTDGAVDTTGPQPVLAYHTLLTDEVSYRLPEIPKESLPSWMVTHVDSGRVVVPAQPPTPPIMVVVMLVLLYMMSKFA